MSLRVHLACVAGAFALLGCGPSGGDAANPKPGAPAAPAAPTAPAAAPAAGGAAGITPETEKEAKEIFALRCTPCHGPTGAGDGPASASLTPPPRNFHDKAWQSGVTDQHIETIIQYGGSAVGKSPAMPPNPDLADKPVVKALRAHIRSLGK